MAEGPGFEPGLTGPEPVVLPLDDPSVVRRPGTYNIYLNTSSKFWIWTFVKNSNHLNLPNLQYTESPFQDVVSRVRVPKWQ